MKAIQEMISRCSFLRSLSYHSPTKGDNNMCAAFAPRRTRLATLLVASTLFGAGSLATSGAALADPCTGPGAPTTTQTKCLTAFKIPATRCGRTTSAGSIRIALSIIWAIARTRHRRH